jgi:hypothetical protein
MGDIMRFKKFMEGNGIIDPKRNPKVTPWEKLADIDSDPADDDYDPKKAALTSKEIDDMYGDDDINYNRSKLGKTAQYPLAQASGKLRGFQVKTPQELFRGKEKLGGQELVDTLRSKLYAGEHMTMKEIDFLQKALNKDLSKIDAEIKAAKEKPKTQLPGPWE